MLKKLKEKILNIKINKEKEPYKLYRIIEGKVIPIDSKSYINVYNVTDKRVYLNKLPMSTPQALIEHLKELSVKDLVVQLEFDRFENKNNIEFEFYLKNNTQPKNSFLEFSEKFRILEIGEFHFRELLKELNL